MSGNKVIKPVSFNKTKEEDRRMLKHLQKRNFSGYVKKLILSEIEKKEQQKKVADAQPIKMSGGIKFKL